MKTDFQMGLIAHVAVGVVGSMLAEMPGFAPEARLNATGLLAQADGARYAAKKAGLNRYCLAD